MTLKVLRMSVTEMDRAIKAYALKLLRNEELTIEERAKYEQLLAARRRRLLRLRSARSLGPRTWGRARATLAKMENTND